MCNRARQLCLAFTDAPVPARLADAFYVRAADGSHRPASDDQLIEAALARLQARFPSGQTLESPQAVKGWLQLHLAPREREVFAVLWLDNRHRILEFTELAHGTIDGAAIYPREVVRTALAFNAAACILAHNHPSGVAEPSSADRAITTRLRDALGLIDVRVLDHIVVGAECVSFAELGLL